eukprot:TRINITY_DN9253_c0_g1_i1.p1 TRINITY_DN9253_c0_g1~~TRINITY_DN9253_c0_g1_i1.p1  ORF type:complete len:165 (-),score=19.89 TRINITY_DN9253_c0_g1_i1:30-524(-)
MIFHGPPGTGKTSCILALAKTLYGPHYHSMTLELNASDERGIDVVRDIIKSFCSTKQIIDKGMKLVILDECDSMTSAAQFALRRIIEQYTTTTRFCLSCNYVSKIIPAILSRCTRFRFTQLKPCLLYTSDAADDTPCVDLGGRRIIKKKKKSLTITTPLHTTQK